jgi:hypothetical protein
MDGASKELPNLFLFENGEQVRNPQDWLRRRHELTDLILEIEYGRLPPAPVSIVGEELHTQKVVRLRNAFYSQYRLTTEGGHHPFQFRLDVLVPPGEGPFPVVLTGDGCWRYVTDHMTLDVLRRGNILGEFSRVEIVPDNSRGDRKSGLYCVYPEGDYGALSAWAWGYHRCVDFLLTLDCVDAARIAVVAHSRGGKAALLAGATDERIALTAPNNSGCGGAGCFRWLGPDAETLADILGAFPYWFSPRLEEFVGKEEVLPFDQHSLKALVAPRALLSTEALGDPWANPGGAWQTYLAAREVYRFLGAEERIGIWYRKGDHGHSQADWAAFLDFVDWQFRGNPPPHRFDLNPFSGLPRAFSWSAPT